jgi:hypothetical protein
MASQSLHLSYLKPFKLSGGRPRRGAVMTGEPLAELNGGQGGPCPPLAQRKSHRYHI